MSEAINLMADDLSPENGDVEVRTTMKRRKSELGTPEGYVEDVIADAKTAKTKDSLAAALASSNPLTSVSWWYLKHPAVRMVTCCCVLLINLYVYLGDPASFSSAKSYATLVGDIYAGFFDPDTPGWLFIRLMVMFSLGALGIWFGVYVQQKWLRDYFHLVLFGYDDGKDPDRDPICDQDGAFFVVFCSMGMMWFIGLYIYYYILVYAGVDESHWPHAGMHGLSFAAYNLILAGLFTYICDWYAVVAVLDQMLQAIDQKEGTGFLAYADDQAEQAEKTQYLRTAGAWWGRNRIWGTRLLLLIGWPPVVISMLIYYFNIMHVLTGTTPDTHVSVGAQWAWTREWNDEYMRMLAASMVAFLNLAIVAQDWDFPDFSGEGVKIVAVDFSSFRFELPQRVVNALSWFPNISKYMVLYISAKWFNYFGIMLGVAFDWAYWFMTALVFRPCDYAQLWDSNTGFIYTMTDKALQDKYAGQASAKNCSWFTDNGVQEFFYNRSNDRQPYVVRVDTGIFTGAYTMNEKDEYVFTGTPAIKMWLMCIPPLVGWVVVAWLIFTHERVTCLNYHKVTAWFDKHGHHHDTDDDDHEVGDSDVDISQLTAKEKKQHRMRIGLKKTKAAAKKARHAAKEMRKRLQEKKAACCNLFACVGGGNDENKEEEGNDSKDGKSTELVKGSKA
jgi:hypothetical protein